ncbi:putative lipopolysaccharide biosynthesis protein [Vibrio cholerae]|nr:putative glycosyltransferase [Vibrio cholerae]GIA50587.1 putative lipopolysaccharide biosynthesis protein [Vibrio cholerae]
MLKVLFISNMFPGPKTPSYGTFVKTNYDQLKSQGFDIEKVVIDTKHSTVVRKFFGYSVFFLKAIFKVLFSKYDVIYVHYLTISTLPLFFLSIFGKKTRFIINIHGDDLVGGRKIHKLLAFSNKRLLKDAIGIILPSEYFLKEMIERYPMLNLKYKSYISYSGGVNLRTFKPKPLNKRRDQNIVFGYVGRIEEGKGWEDLVNAIGLLPTDIRAEFRFFGSGAQFEQLRERASKCINSKLIRVNGSITYEQVPAVFRSFDYFIFPTHRESLGLVLLESMASGIPAIVSNIEPLSDIYRFSNVGFFETGDPRSLKNSILEYYNLSDKEYELAHRSLLNEVQKYDSVSLSKELGCFVRKVSIGNNEF